jgi:glucose-1-phosphate adenylyltransferase
MDLLRDELARPGGALALDDPAWPLRTAATLQMPARVARTGRVDDALLSPGAFVAGTVERSVLGPGVVVEAGAEVRDSVLLHRVTVRRGARVTRAVLDDDVEVGREAAVGGPDGDLCVVGQRVRVAPGEVVAAGTERDAEGAAAAALTVAQS